MIEPHDFNVRPRELWAQLRHALVLMALTAGLCLATAWLAPLIADDALEIACETDRIKVVIDQPACAERDPGGDPVFGPGPCLGPVCQPCQDPLDWLPPGELLLIHLHLTTETF